MKKKAKYKEPHFTLFIKQAIKKNLVSLGRVEIHVQYKSFHLFQL